MADNRQGLWARPRRGARGPSPEHTLDEIAAAAIRLATAEGLAAVSMRAVATELGTTASSLYRYVASRDELLDLIVDTAMAGFGVKLPQRRGWLDDLVRLAQATLDLYLAQPWLLDARPARSAPGPNTLAWFEHCLACMEPLDRPVSSKMEAIGVLNGVIMLFARTRTAPAEVDFSAVDPARHPLLLEAFNGLAAAQPTEGLFERVVRAVLSGLLGEPHIR